MRALSVGFVQPEKSRLARAEVNLASRSSSVSSVGGWTGKPSAVRGIPSIRDQREGVAVESGVVRCRSSRWFNPAEEEVDASFN